jgi:hypothetical protein
MFTRSLIRFITATLLISVSPVSATVIYVKWDAAGANNGTSWEDAYMDLQTAIGAAIDGDTIWVAGGTYKPTGGTGPTSATISPASAVRRPCWHFAGFTRIRSIRR